MGGKGPGSEATQSGGAKGGGNREMKEIYER
jgi:hypothetical protein